MRLFCCGYGYVARYLAQSFDGQVWGTSRSTGKADFVLSDDAALDAAGRDALAQATHVLVSIPPGQDGADAAWQHHADAIRGKWIGYLSTTGVYGDWQGEWVGESSALKATEERSVRRIKAERHWQALGATIFRLAGIYGPERNALQQVKAGTAKRIYKEGQYFSRIHVADIVQVLLAAIAQDARGEVFNLCDDAPAPSHEIVAYACGLLGGDAPPMQAYEEADLSAMAKSFYASNRRVRNEKIKFLLGVNLLYPSYIEGLASLLHSDGKF